MTDIPVNPAVLTWARNERNLSREEAAARLSITVVDLHEYEAGRRVPNVTMLRLMASKYEISFASLLMPEPLPASTRLRVTDFRTHGGEGVVWGPELLALLDQINLDLEALADLRDYSPQLFGDVKLPEADMSIDPVRLAASERLRVGISVDAQLGWMTEAETFRHLRALVEDQGVFVHVTKADTAEHWRGLTIYDNRRLPMIVINGDEPKAGRRTFSLFHEYAHVLLRMSAISGSGRPDSTVERFCNQFAAHFLMPSEPFVQIAQFVRAGASGPWTDHQIRKIADRFKLSMSAVALHLEDVGLAGAGLYSSRRNFWKTGKKAKGGAFIDYLDKVANQYGSRHLGIVLRATDEGLIDTLDAHELIGVAPSKFGLLGQKVRERQAAYGWAP